MKTPKVVSSTPEVGKLRKSLSENTSLRRRSLLINTISANITEECNDDEAERSELLASERATSATSTPTIVSIRQKNASDTSGSISSPQKEHFQGCLKLYAENKITKDNAWNLQLIDFMTSMLRRHDHRMENLQVASTVVDASTRIYSLRVDAVHHEVLKMAGGLVKATQAKRGRKDDDSDQIDDGINTQTQIEANVKKKKKKTRGSIADPSSLNGDADLNETVDPFLERLASMKGDVTSSNRAFNATLPVDPNVISLIISTEQAYLEDMEQCLNEELELLDTVLIPYSLLAEYKQDDDICEPFKGFSITNWNPDDEESNRINNWLEENRLNLSQQAVAFDMNADVEPIPLNEQENELFDDEPLGGLSDDETEVCVAACAALRAAPARLVSINADQSSKTSLISLANLHSKLEYSAVLSAWAGPSHWRLRASKLSSVSSNIISRGTNECVTAKEKIQRSKKTIDFTQLVTTPNVVNILPAAPHKIMISRKTLALSHTWNENNFKTPIDRGLDESHFYKLYLKKNIMMQRKSEETQALETVVPEEIIPEYDYQNENDVSYCVGSQPNDNEDVWDEDGTTQRHSLGDEDPLTMIEPPAKVAKIFVPYAMRAKKVDMKQLKNTTWKIITGGTGDTSEKQIESTTFTNIVKMLPNHLSSGAKEGLSLSLSLLAVLHLANEKGLILENHNDLKDFTIVGLIDK